MRQLDFPHSVGLLYSAFTYFCGFKVNSGEYKLMGLAPYGDENSPQTKHWIRIISDNLVDIRNDGSIVLNMEYFDFATGLTMSNDRKWEELFGVAKREPETDITQPYMNLAFAIQSITEDIVFRMADTAKSLTQADCLALAGGVALNCVANGKLLRSGKFKKIWIQPAAGDAGGALGAAYAAWHLWDGNQRKVDRDKDSMKGAYLGPRFSQIDIERVINRHSGTYKKFISFDMLCDHVAESIANGKVVGWFQGRMEYGPRALGNRSILGDPRNPEMQKKMNLKIKYREGFRPFAPSVIEEDILTYFDLSDITPYMLLVSPVQKNICKPRPANYSQLPLHERLYVIRSEIPAVTHVDYSARIQSVSRETNPKYWNLINTFKRKTGCGLLVNTSFNVRGEPIVCTPNDAYVCFMRTEMDILVMDNYLLDKAEQLPWMKDDKWKHEFELD